MATLASESRADWGFVNDPKLMQAVEKAARGIAGKYRDNAVSSLAEYDDLYQDALIILATSPGLQACEPGLVQYRLAAKLMDKVRPRARRATRTVSQDATLGDSE